MGAESLLAGLRVVELGQYVAAPYAATLLADHGAEVVKIERPGGDPLRVDPARFEAWNRGKRTVELDLRSAAGRTSALEIMDGADVVLENLRPGALEDLGLSLATLRARHPGVVTCSISAYGSSGPSRDDPGWEPLVHARAGCQQGLFTGDEPIWLPFPMASVAAALLGVLGVSAALLKRETTGYGQHVETSLLEALLFLNAGPIFHRPRHRPRVFKQKYSPILHTYVTKDGRGMQVNLSGTERWRELCRLVGLEDDGGLDYAKPATLARLSDRDWCNRMREAVAAGFVQRTADEWEEALEESPAATAKCNSLAEWLADEQVRANGLLTPDGLVGPPVCVHTGGESRATRRHGSEGGALAGVRVVDVSSFWAGPLAARLLAELGADVVKVEPPGGEGAYQLMPVLPNIYVDANRSKRGVTLDLRDEGDRDRLLDLVAVADVVVENAVAGTWERLGLGEDALRAVSDQVVYARAKGFGSVGPLAPRPAFDYVVQAATGMEMTQGGDRPQPVNFTANDYATGLHLAAGISLALLGRARGTSVTSVEASLMATATAFQSEQVAQLARLGYLPDSVGQDLRGPSPACHLYEASDGWLTMCAMTAAQRAAVGTFVGVAGWARFDVARAVEAMSVAQAVEALRSLGVPVAVSVHPNAVPDDVQVVARRLLISTSHPAAGRFVQVGIPLQLSVDMPAVRGPAPAPVRDRDGRAART